MKRGYFDLDVILRKASVALLLPSLLSFLPFIMYIASVLRRISLGKRHFLDSASPRVSTRHFFRHRTETHT